MILEEGLNVKVVLFPDGDDPDSYSRKVSFEELQNYIHEASQDFMLFKSGILMQDAKHDPVKKAELIKDIVHSIALIPDGIKRSIYIRECSNMFELTEQVLITEMNKSLRKLSAQKTGASIPPEVEKPMPLIMQQPQVERSDLYYQEKELIHLLLNYADYLIPVPIPGEENPEESIKLTAAEIVFYQLELDGILFEYETFASIYNEFYRRFIDEGFTPQPRELLKTDDTELQQTVTELIAHQYELSENWAAKHRIYTKSELDQLDKKVFNTLLSFKQKKVEQMALRIQENIAKIQEDEERKDNVDLINSLLMEKKELDDMKRVFAGMLGRIITR